MSKHPDWLTCGVVCTVMSVVVSAPLAVYASMQPGDAPEWAVAGLFVSGAFLLAGIVAFVVELVTSR